ncbi:MAG: hypothetical protein CMK07_15820 [Ponticaulis sp.]|nr:hypothetical protein [Ponticaulis sp.]
MKRQKYLTIACLTLGVAGLSACDRQDERRERLVILGEAASTQVQAIFTGEDIPSFEADSDQSSEFAPEASD